MRLLIVLILLLLPCPFARVIAPPATPTPTPTIPSPHVEISASATSVLVGETFTLRGIPVNLGLPIYTLTLNSGATASVTYDDQPRDIPAHAAPAPDALFEIVAARGEMNSVTFTLRALAPGSADAVISATGEARTPEGAFMWSFGSSETVTLTVSE